MELIPEDPVTLSEVGLELIPMEEGLGEHNPFHIGTSIMDFELVLALVEGNEAVPELLSLLQGHLILWV